MRQTSDCMLSSSALTSLFDRSLLWIESMYHHEYLSDTRESDNPDMRVPSYSESAVGHGARALTTRNCHFDT